MFGVFNAVCLTVFMLACLYPFYYVLINSLSDPNRATGNIFLIPAGFTLDSFKEVLGLDLLGNAFLVSAGRTILGTILCIAVCSAFAYGVTKETLWGRKFIFRLSVVTMYFNAGLIPWYLTMKAFGLQNNFLLYIIPMAANAYYVILIKTFFEQLPPALEESAKLDGAGNFTIFGRIVLPLSKPILATITVFSAVNQWNSWNDNFFLVQSEKLKTVQLIMYEYLNQAQAISTTGLGSGSAVHVSPETIKMTIAIVGTLPIVFVYPFMQKYFVKGLLMGSIKG